MQPISFAWRNLRGFENTTEFEAPAFTLLIGRNNVGKSSAYTPLLLMKQTLRASDPRTALLSRGDFIDVGPYSDYVSRHDIERRVAFRIDIPTSPSIPRFSFGGGGDTGGLVAKSVEMTFQSSDGTSAELYRHVVIDKDGKAIVTRTRKRTGPGFTVRSPLLPEATSVGRPLREVTELRRGLQSETPDGFSFSGLGALLLPRSWRQDEDRWNKVRDWYNATSELVDVYQNTNFALGHWLRGISYLGPLRSLSQRTYRLAPELPSNVGRDGQHAPEILFRGRDDELLAKTDEWLTRLGYGTVQFKPLGEDYFQMFIEQPDGVSVNVAHSGVGLSQLLPLLVQGIATAKDGTLIAQQPEIHLNPAQQGIMADFLIDLAKAERRVLVESHSEHVLLRLRRRDCRRGHRSLRRGCLLLRLKKREIEAASDRDWRVGRDCTRRLAHRLLRGSAGRLVCAGHGTVASCAMRLAARCGEGVVIDTNVMAHADNAGDARHPSSFAVAAWLRDHPTVLLVLDDQGKKKPDPATSVLFSEYRETLSPQGFALTLIMTLLASGRVAFAERPDRETRESIAALVPRNKPDRAVLGAACGCADHTLVSNDYDDFPDAVRDRCAEELGVEILDSAEAAA